MSAHKLILFDSDGTLQESMYIYRPAIRKMTAWLREQDVEFEEPSDARISGWLGVNAPDMWNDFMPDADPKLKSGAAHMVGHYMCQNILDGIGRWYDGVREMLDALKNAGYRLAVLSNCGHSYAEAQWRAFGMERWFEAFFYCEAWDYAPKGVMLRDIAGDYQAALKRTPLRRTAGNLSEQDPVEQGTGAGSAAPGKDKRPEAWQVCAMVGDRDSDLEAAEFAGVPFVGCLYGYGREGELDRAQMFAWKPLDIAECILRRQS